MSNFELFACIFYFKAEKGEAIGKPLKSKKVEKKASPSKNTSKKVKRSAVPKKKLTKPTPSSTVAKSNGKQSIRQRPHLHPSTLNNNNDNHNVSSSDEDDQTVKSATESRITYAIAINNRMVQDGCSNSGSNGGDSSGGSGANAISEPATVAAVEGGQCKFAARYPKRNVRAVNYKQQLDTPSDDDFICKCTFLFHNCAISKNYLCYKFLSFKLTPTPNLNLLALTLTLALALALALCVILALALDQALALCLALALVLEVALALALELALALALALCLALALAVCLALALAL